MMSVLVIIPARGGSKGIPRKNLRPLNGKPLIYYVINSMLTSAFKPDVLVTTDDEEIGYFASQFGAEVYYRNKSLGGDSITLDPVVYEAYEFITRTKKKKYDCVATVQPTSPLLSVFSFDEAVQKLVNDEKTHTVISVVLDTHLTWEQKDGLFFPLYKKRVNRQLLPKVFKETGGFLISRSTWIKQDSRIGERVDLQVLPNDEGIDIDTYEDWSICEYLLGRKTILFCVSGYLEIGLGHVYNCLILANEILNHKIVFLVDSKSKLAMDKIRESNYEVHMQVSENLVDDILRLAPSVVINDRLDTNAEYVLALKKLGLKVVNIEDLGSGAEYADLVFNAIYPESKTLPNHFIGSDYFCAREEFYLFTNKLLSTSVNSILITFGGVDPSNLTKKVLEAIYDECERRNIKINVVLGLGYKEENSLLPYKGIEISRNSKSISQYMNEADIAFSSAGRTIYELALTNTPSIILAQNRRELSHVFASSENGFINLGLGTSISLEEIQRTFLELVENVNLRRDLFEKMKRVDLKSGKNRVLKLLKSLIEN